jgi:predicted dinucleotide-binding enzyme
MTTAIIGVGNIGSRVARDLVAGGERVVLAARDQSSADDLAAQLGELASSASVADAVSNADAVVLAVYLDADQELIPQLSQALVGKVVIDPSNPFGLDSQGAVIRTLPDDESAGSVVANLLPAGAHYVKAFGTMGADALGSAVNREPQRAVLFYATDDDIAAATAERLIRVSGFDPVKVGGIEAAGRIEAPGGDLHQGGGLHGRLLNIGEARAAV